jgi:hypothetical protein
MISTVLHFTNFLSITVGTSVSPARLSESAHLLDHCIQEIKLKIERHKASNLQGPSSQIVVCCAFFYLRFLIYFDMKRYLFLSRYISNIHNYLCIHS